MDAIIIKNICKNYKNIKALNNINITIKENELFGLLGVNGAGKSTLIKLIASVIVPTSGSITCYDFDTVKDMDKVKEIVDFSPQDSAVCENLTVKENLLFIAETYGLKNDEKKSKVLEVIDSLGLNEVINQKAKTLSGGYLRRLSIAMALVSNPKILMLDEPTLGLDVLAKRDLWDIINKLKKQITIILTTHNIEEAGQLCDKIAILVKGEVFEIGTVEQLKQIGNSDNFEDAFVNIVRKEK